MSATVNLTPVKEWLTSIKSPQDLAQVLDELAYDYAQLYMELYGRNDFVSPKSCYHPDASTFMWWLHELRDVFRACEKRENKNHKFRRCTQKKSVLIYWNLWFYYKWINVFKNKPNLFEIPTKKAIFASYFAVLK